MEKINFENWTHTSYTLGVLRAFISIGATPNTNDESIEVEYLVTLTDQDYQEIFQTSHSLLEEALAVINQKYGHFELEDSLKPTAKEGCGSCAAH